jgi:hydrogenase maturation protein HypF
VSETLRVRGTVQGVGFRPFVYRLAHDLGIAGRVCNDADGVLIRAEGSPQDLARFRASLRCAAPPSAAIDEIAVEPAEGCGYDAFEIEASSLSSQLKVRVPHDLATCAACRREVFDPCDRRHGYPFTNCTDCGPRYSIIGGLPYERAATSMRRFVMCSACRQEYGCPEERRFHAQPNACGACGPHVALWDCDGRELARGEDALIAAAGLIRDGRIVALKGLGGFQLLVRADRSGPVARLRGKKGRPSKPLAVMVPSLEAAARLGVVGPVERRLLASPENPIVLLDRRPPDPARGGSELAPDVAPRMASLGVLLPTTPLHHRLLAALDCTVVATSGNRGDEPIVTDERDAVGQLHHIADAFLVHDRPIVRRVDDSVVRVIAHRSVTIRLARGYAPFPLPTIERLIQYTGAEPGAVLATGGHQKVAVALWSGSQAVLAQHVGDLDAVATQAAYARLVPDLCGLYRCEPAAIACDLHPDYFTTRWAFAQGRPIVRVQHHHAHAVAGMVEHGLLDREVLAVTWDGTGYGPDGTVWGGEVLRARIDRYHRVASLRPFPLPGNEMAIRQPRRVALGLLALTFGEEAVLGDTGLLGRLGLAPHDARTLLRMVRCGVNTVWTSSIGRLFDAVAALLLGAGEVSYEGEAAAWLESVADPTVTDAYDLPLRPPWHGTVIGDSAIPRGDWQPMLLDLSVDLSRQVDIGVIAARFHNTLARWVAAVVARQPRCDVVLGGGCFQNRRLTEATLRAIQAATGDRVYGPGRIPPGDGGLSAGQLATALSLLINRGVPASHS